MEQEFAGKVAVITGAGAGFGAGFSAALALRGASVAVFDIDLPAAEQTASAIRERGGAAMAVRCDVTDQTEVAGAVAKVVDAWGGVDVLINNAGLHSAEYNKSFSVLGGEKVRRLFDVNIMGVVNCSLACRPAMAARGGGVIMSLSSTAGFGSSNPYGVSKLAVRGLTVALSGEFAKDNIRVNAIAPGLIATDRIRADFPQEFFDRFLQMQHVHRTGEVEDIVQAMLYLCSDRSSFVTGETLKVGGGTNLQI
jgi:3-oxoacyl-[acyl-carrier protein] reductase